MTQGRNEAGVGDGSRSAKRSKTSSGRGPEQSITVRMEDRDLGEGLDRVKQRIVRAIGIASGEDSDQGKTETKSSGRGPVASIAPALRRYVSSATRAQLGIHGT